MIQKLIEKLNKKRLKERISSAIVMVALMVSISGVVGAVVEGQENPLRVVDLPDQRREQVTDYFGRLEFHDEKKYSGGVRHRQR